MYLMVGGFEVVTFLPHMKKKSDSSAGLVPRRAKQLKNSLEVPVK